MPRTLPARAPMQLPAPRPAEPNLYQRYGSQLLDLFKGFDEASKDSTLPAAAREHAQKGRASVALVAKKVDYALSRMKANPANAISYAQVLTPVLAGDLAQLERELGRASAAHQTVYRVRQRSRQNMGIWSLNPNLWGLTQDEALEYERKQREAELAASQAESQILVTTATAQAQADQLNPTIGSALSGAARSTVEATSMTYKLVLLLGIAALGVWGYSEIKKAQHPNERSR